MPSVDSQTSPAPRSRKGCGDNRTISLPVIGPDGNPIRPSRTGRWRAFSLIMVHVLIGAHVLHWLWKGGETLSPVEPSEAMETLTTGRVNAGFLFFALALLSTLVLGRFLCGWACHLVAYQDLTAWILKKLHLRPRAFRSRFLVFVPLLAALYMFVWPVVYRKWVGAPDPRMALHLTRAGFWDTFPGLGVAALTVLICGVVMVYLLGPKGFCTYACPYGGFFGLLDKLAVGRIHVTDACNQCGHCTAVCTSNVDVAKEVKLHKMIVDPGCMKCMDCVSVCPNDALHFDFGFPKLKSPPQSPAPPRKWDLTLPQEVAALLLFGVAMLCFRGLYGHIPFLLSLGIGACVAFLVLKAWALFRAPDVLIQKVRLKTGGRIRPVGYAYAAFVALLVAFAAHSGYWRYHDFTGRFTFAGLPQDVFGWQYDTDFFDRLSTDDRERAGATARHFENCRRAGFTSLPEHDANLSWLYLLTGQWRESRDALERSMQALPHDVSLLLRRAAFSTTLNDLDGARRDLKMAIEWTAPERDRSSKLGLKARLPLSSQVWLEWGEFLSHRGELDEARAALELAVNWDSQSTLAWQSLGRLQARVGENDAARASFVRAVALAPQNVGAAAELEALGKQEQNFAGAAGDYDAAVKFHDDVPVFHCNRAFALASTQRYRDAIDAYQSVIRLNPKALKARADMGAVMLATGDVAGAVQTYESLSKLAPTEPEVAFKLAFLYQQSGRPADAARQYQVAAEHGSAQIKSAAREALRQLGH